MVQRQAAALDAVFAALSSRTRRAILARLARGGARVSDLAAPFDVSLPAVSKHLRVLEEAGLVARRREGRVQHCRLLPGRLKAAADWIDRYRRYWGVQLDALGRHLAEEGAACESSTVPTDPRSSARSASRSTRRGSPTSRSRSSRST